MEDDESLTYADAGVDIAASEAATSALIESAQVDLDESYAGVMEINGTRIGLTTDGVGTKLLVAEAIERYDTIGIDCVAMNVNDLIAEGLRPIGFVDYLALEHPDEALTAAIGEGLARGANQAGVALLGGETAILPEVVSSFDLAGAAVGIGSSEMALEGEPRTGDRLVGVPASGIHSNGLTLARQAIQREHAYTDPFPAIPDRTIGEELLEPTRIYPELVDAIERFDISACAHITGGGIHNLLRLGTARYVIDDPLPIPPIFPFIQSCGNIDKQEMYRTFNMGTGFVLLVDPEEADALAEFVDGKQIGHVEAGEGISLEGEELSPAGEN